MFLSHANLLLVALVGGVVAIPFFVVARRYGRKGVIISLGAPVVVAAALLPLGMALQALMPDGNFFAWGMATWMLWCAVAFCLPFGMAAALLGLWRRRVAAAAGR